MVVDLGQFLPVDRTPCYLAAIPEAVVGPYCTILAMQVTVVRTERTFGFLSAGNGLRGLI